MLNRTFCHIEHIYRQLIHTVHTTRQIPTDTSYYLLMTGHAFWRVNYFAVFFTEYLNFTWYYIMEAIYLLNIQIINLYSLFIVLFHCLVTKTIRQSIDGRMSFDKGNYGRSIRNDPDARSTFYDTALLQTY